jgi:hypothetical protein
MTPRQVAEGLRPLLEGPVEHVLAIGPPSSARSPDPVGGYRYSVVAVEMDNTQERYLARRSLGIA